MLTTLMIFSVGGLFMKIMYFFNKKIIVLLLLEMIFILVVTLLMILGPLSCSSFSVLLIMLIFVVADSVLGISMFISLSRNSNSVNSISSSF